MPNITLSLPKEIFEIIKKHSEIRWSEIARQAFEQYIDRLKKLELLEYQDKLKAYDEMLKNSELTEEDVMKLDEKIKEGIHKKVKASLK
jgi:hypothetical protein